jgi:hypothetical protein
MINFRILINTFPIVDILLLLNKENCTYEVNVQLIE